MKTWRPTTLKPSARQTRWQHSGRASRLTECDQQADLPGCTVWPALAKTSTASLSAASANSAGIPTTVSSKYANTVTLSSITVNKTNIGYKTEIYDNTRTKLSGDQYFWASNKYLDAQNLIGKKLYFAKDEAGTGKQKVEGVRVSAEQGYTTTFTFGASINKNMVNNEIYQFVEETDSLGSTYVVCKKTNKSQRGLYNEYQTT